MLAAAIVSSASGQQIVSPWVPGQIVVIPSGDAGARAQDDGRFGGHVVLERSEHGRALLLDVRAGQELQAALALVKAGLAASAELNYWGQGAFVPNDSFFASQWHHANTGQSGGLPGADIQSTLAWDITRGDPTTLIAVLDSGIDSDHPDLVGTFLTNGFDFVAEDANPEGDHPHGSWVSGCIVASANNQFGVTGVDHEARVLPVKVLNQDNGGTTFDLIQGIDFAAARADVQIINMSLINYPGTSALQLSLQNAFNAGKVLISCGSNGGLNTADASWPGASPFTITIGATDRFDRRASFSGSGSTIDFVAPGSSVVTVRPGSASNTSESVSGCSFATPITAGVVGLLRARAVALGVPFTQSLVFDMLQAGAEDMVGLSSEDTPGRDNFMGWGRINAHRTLLAFDSTFDCNMDGILDIPVDLDEDGVDDLCDDTCVSRADTNADGMTSPADFSAWIAAFNAQSPACDQNNDNACTPADFSAWIANFNAGC